MQHDAAILRFVNSHDAQRLAELGTSCPDHFLRTKIKPLYADWNPGEGYSGESQGRCCAPAWNNTARITRPTTKRCKRPDSPAMRDPNPTVILIPGIGMIAWGKDKSESRVTAEFYNCAVEVMRGAEAIDEYIALPQQEAFDIEYWLLEEAKLRRMPAEKELAREVIVWWPAPATGYYGKAVAPGWPERRRACGVRGFELSAQPKERRRNFGDYGPRLGDRRSGQRDIRRGPAVGLAAGRGIAPACGGRWKDLILAYGGLDNIVVTAGVFVPPDPRRTG